MSRRKAFNIFPPYRKAIFLSVGTALSPAEYAVSMNSPVSYLLHRLFQRLWENYRCMGTRKGNSSIGSLFQPSSIYPNDDWLKNKPLLTIRTSPELDHTMQFPGFAPASEKYFSTPRHCLSLSWMAIVQTSSMHSFFAQALPSEEHHEVIIFIAPFTAMVEQTVKTTTNVSIPSSPKCVCTNFCRPHCGPKHEARGELANSQLFVVVSEIAILENFSREIHSLMALGS